MDPLILGLALILAAEALFAIRAAYRLSQLYRTRLTDSEFFRRSVTRNKRTAYIAGGVIVLVIVWSLLALALPGHVAPIPRPWGTVAVAVALMIALAGPIGEERYVSRLRSDGS